MNAGVIYAHARETWTHAECDKRARARKADGMGSRGPRGIVCSSADPYGPQYGGQRLYNGGCIRAGEWYAGESWPLPAIPGGYEFVNVSAWGLRIQVIA